MSEIGFSQAEILADIPLHFNTKLISSHSLNSISMYYSVSCHYSQTDLTVANYSFSWSVLC